MGNRILTEEEYNHLIETEDMYKKLIAERDELRKDRDNWRDWFYELRYALRKDERLDESISCVRDIPSDVEMIEDLKKRASDSDCYKEMSELLKEKLKNANELANSWEKHYEETLEQFVYPLCDIVYPNISNADINMTGLLEDVKHLKVYADDSDHYKELADSWKRDYERLRDEFIYPIYNILYPDKVDLDINVTDLLRDVKNLKVYAEENESMFKELQKWREKSIARGNDIDHLLSEIKEKDKKISELGARVKYWSNRAIDRCQEVTEVTKDRDKWRRLYNSLSETCADYDKRCKEECEKKYRDEISKLQNIVTEKHVEIKRLKKEILDLNFDTRTIESMSKKNSKLNQTISDQEVTIKALLITIKEMCKEGETNE